MISDDGAGAILARMSRDSVVEVVGVQSLSAECIVSWCCQLCTTLLMIWR